MPLNRHSNEVAVRRPRSFWTAGVAGIGISLALIVATPAAQAESGTMRVSHGVPTQAPIGQLIADWTTRIDQRTGADLRVVEFPSNQLLRTKSEVSAVSRGHIQSVIITNTSWGLTDPYIAGLTRPFSFTSYDEFTDFLATVEIESSPQYAALGVRRLGWIWVADVVGVTSNDQPLDTVERFEGVKIRGLDGLVNSALIALGAAPVTMGGGEAFQALQTNLIEASITTLQAVHQRRYFEVQDWCVAVPMYITAFGVYVNEDWWDAQPQSVQIILEEETAALESESVQLSARELAELPTLIRESGMRYKTMSDSDIAELALTANTAWERAYLAETGAAGKSFLRSFRQWQARRTNSH